MLLDLLLSHFDVFLIAIDAELEFHPGFCLHVWEIEGKTSHVACDLSVLVDLEIDLLVDLDAHHVPVVVHFTDFTWFLQL